MANAKKKRALQRCSTCRRLRRGHVGPTGPKCNMPHGDDDPVDTGSPQKKNVQPRDSKSETVTDEHTDVKTFQTPKVKLAAGKAPVVDPFLNELAAQLGQLTLNIQQLSKDNQSMKADIATCKAGSRSIPVEGAPSWPRPIPGTLDGRRTAGESRRPRSRHLAHVLRQRT